MRIADCVFILKLLNFNFARFQILHFFYLVSIFQNYITTRKVPRVSGSKCVRLQKEKQLNTRTRIFTRRELVRMCPCPTHLRYGYERTEGVSMLLS